MPTSQEIQDRKEKERQDSVLRETYRLQEEQQRQMDDSLFDPAVQAEEETTPSTTTFRDSYSASGASSGLNRFHVVVGSFREPGNATRMVKRLESRGYRPQELLFKNGFMVVSAGSYPYLQDAQAAVGRLRANDGVLFPEIYIYDMNQRRHIER